VSRRLSYVLPLRSLFGDRETEELTGYLAWLGARADLVIVDGSDRASFEAHRRRWAVFATHVRPAEDIRCLNGKVRGVLTGLRVAAEDAVVIADDDVRYDDDNLDMMRRLLADADLVRPQNHFDPLPWYARWDTARILCNRAFGNDFPGTMGVRRSFLRSIGGYDGNVLFENLELIRTVTAAGGRVIDAPDLFVRRRPPTFTRFLEQRPRQAYEDWAQPLRFAVFLAAGPAVAAVTARRPRRVLLGAALAIGAASVGRARHGGRLVFDRVSPLLAPLWFVERAIFSWVALARRLIGGGYPYRGTVIRRAATPPRMLRKRIRSPLEG
jgi:Glycosyltransferase like family 2